VKSSAANHIYYFYFFKNIAQLFVIASDAENVPHLLEDKHSRVSQFFANFKGFGCLWCRQPPAHFKV
jgi:hypothetical protein